ncbi:conserved hypothetical protein, membrane or secreted [Beggiatoa sp. PS]|nr:conserved hypothetical protein, membrane or secreted [Beggiatoa sp. PS]
MGDFLIKKFMKRHSHSQTGAALIIFLTIMVLGVSAILLSELNTNTDLMLDDQAQTAQILAQAKEALIGYAVNYYDTVSSAGISQEGRYGFLPCPDVDNNVAYPEGVEHGNCVGQDQSSLGRLPWRTLGLPPLRDGAGECLWYAISGTYKNATIDTVRTNMLNEDTNGLFEVLLSDGTTTPSTIVGQTPQDRAIAVIIAPGKRLSSQTRQTESDTEICGGNYTATNYLDSDSTANVNNADFSIDADTVNEFITTQDNSSPINDQIAYITREELWSYVRKRTDFMENMQTLTRTAAQCIANYPNSLVDRRLPWAAPMNLLDYSEDSQYDDQSALLSGRLPDIVKNSNTIINKANVNLKLMTECSSITSDDELSKLWQNWKDHLFYAVAEAHKPDADSSTPTCTTTNCLTVNGNLYAAVVMFANSPLPAGKQDNSQQVRDIADKADITNYLEQTNATNTGGNGTYLQWNMSDDDGDETNDINDILYCIDGDDLSVTFCPSPP